MRQISFALPAPYPLLNRSLRTHWSFRRSYQASIRATILEQIGGPAGLPHEPFQKARVVIERHSVGTPDYDNLVGGGKPLIDCLTTPVMGKGGRQRNKRGLGIVVDDSPAHLTAEYHAVKCRLCEQKTVVTITELEAAP